MRIFILASLLIGCAGVAQAHPDHEIHHHADEAVEIVSEDQTQS